MTLSSSSPHVYAVVVTLIVLGTDVGYAQVASAGSTRVHLAQLQAARLGSRSSGSLRKAEAISSGNLCRDSRVLVHLPIIQALARRSIPALREAGTSCRINWIGPRKTQQILTGMAESARMKRPDCPDKPCPQELP